MMFRYLSELRIVTKKVVMSRMLAKKLGKGPKHTKEDNKTDGADEMNILKRYWT